MFMQLENPAVVQTQPFPHCVAGLHRRIERADPGLIAMHQLSVDVHNQVAVSFVEFLKHWFNCVIYADKADCVVVAAFVSNAELPKQALAAASPSTIASKIRGNPSLPQSVLIKPVVTFVATLVNFVQALRHLIVRRTIWPKRCRLCHFAIPIPGPNSIRLAQSRRPGQPRPPKLDTDCPTKQPPTSL